MFFTAQQDPQSSNIRIPKVPTKPSLAFSLKSCAARIPNLSGSGSCLGSCSGSFVCLPYVFETKKRVCHSHHLSFNPKKWEKPEKSPRDNAWQSLGLILSYNKVLMVDHEKNHQKKKTGRCFTHHSLHQGVLKHFKNSPKKGTLT